MAIVHSYRASLIEDAEPFSSILEEPNPAYAHVSDLVGRIDRG